MDIAIVASNSIKIKGKKISIITDPMLVTTKTSSEIVLLLEKIVNFSISEKIVDVKLTISGAGEYEVAGTKITVLDFNGNLFYSMMIDNLDICVAKVSAMQAAKEKLKDYQVCILNADEILNQTLIGDLNPAVLCFYGEKAVENVKAFGKEVQAVDKFSTSKEKLPQEMQVVLLSV